MEAPYADRLVVDLSTGVAGGYCTKMLADAGATVVKVEPREGDPLRRDVPPGVTLADGEDSALFGFLAAGKHSVVVAPGEADRLQPLLAAADLVVMSGDDHLSLSAADVRRLAPAASVVTITPFGLDSTWAGRPVDDLVLQALAGGMWMRGPADRPPLSVGGGHSGWMAGMFAATAAAVSLARGGGELVDVSVLEALVATQSMYPVTWFSVSGRPHRDHRRTNIPDIEPSRDGYVGFMIVTAQMWESFAVMVEHPEWLDDPGTYTYAGREARRGELVAATREWTSQRTTDEVLEACSLLRVPAAPVGNGETVVTMDHFVERGAYVRSADGSFVAPVPTYRIGTDPPPYQPRPAPRLGEHTDDYLGRPRPPVQGGAPKALPLAGVKVADFTMFWAGPIIGNFLGMFGADVVHVESPTRPDGMRGHTTKTQDDDAWWESAPLFHATNTDKRGLAVDLGTEDGLAVARRLIEWADVVVENFSPRVMESWGLTYDTVRGINPNAVMVRCPAFGLTGPWRDRQGFAQTMEQVSGLAWLTGYPDGPPTTVNGVCDPTAGTHATFAVLAGLELRRRTGHGVQVESPMISSALNVAARQVVEFSAYGHLAMRAGNRGDDGVVRNLYETDVDDEWVAVAVADDEQWSGLRAALGHPAWAVDTALDTATGRHAAAGVIDERLAEWCRARGTDEIVGQLGGAGVPCAPVVPPYRTDEVVALQERRFYEEVTHPVTGAGLYPRFPARFSAGPDRMNRQPAPMLGQHNHAVLTEIGYGPEEIARLEAAGVVGDRPHVALVAR